MQSGEGLGGLTSIHFGVNRFLELQGGLGLGKVLGFESGFLLVSRLVGVWGKGSGLDRVLGKLAPGLRAREPGIWEEALPIPADPYLHLSPDLRRSSSA